MGSQAQRGHVTVKYVYELQKRQEEHKFQLLQLVSYYGWMKKYFQMSEQTIAGLIIMIQKYFQLLYYYPMCLPNS